MAEDRAHGVGALRDGEQRESRDETRRRQQAEQRDREPEDRDGDQDAQTAPLRAVDPATGEGDDGRASAGRRVQQAEALRSDGEHAIGVIRHDRARHGEERREEVDGHRREQERTRPEERHPVRERPQRRGMDDHDVTSRHAHQQQRASGDEERRDVDPVGRREAESRDQHACERRPDDLRDLELRLIECHRRRNETALDEARRQRGPRGLVERAEARADRGQEIQHRNRCHTELRRHCQRDGREREAGVRDEQHAPTIDAVRDDAAPKRQRDERHRGEQSQETDRERRTRQEVDLVRDRDETKCRSGLRDELPEPQEPKLARGA